MPDAPDPSTDVRAAMRGVRALLLDLDGVIVLAGKTIAGSVDAVAALERRRMPYRIVTNTSAVSRETLSRWSRKLGVPIPAERFESALSASAAWTARTYPDAPLYVLASEDARSEFAGQRLLSHDEAGAKGAATPSSQRVMKPHSTMSTATQAKSGTMRERLPRTRYACLSTTASTRPARTL